MKFVNAEDLFNQAQENHRNGNTDVAESMYNALLSKSVGNPMILFQLGTLHMQKGNNGLAIELLDKSVKSNSDFGPAWNHLGICLKKVDMEKAADFAFEQAERLMPKVPDIPNNRAAIYVNNGKPEECLKHANRALLIDPNHVMARWHKALALLEMQQWETAWFWHEARLDPQSGCDVAHRNYAIGKETPWWDGKSKGLVVVHGEQGLGDEIMFSSCLPDALKTGAEFVLECNPRLHGLFQRSFPQIKVHGTHETDGKEWKGDREVDFKIALGSLPKYCRKKEADFPGTPFLIPDPDKTKIYRQRLSAISDKPKIGIAWQGGVRKTRADLRSIHLPMLRPLLEQQADFISLQYHDSAKEDIEELFEKTGLIIHHWEEAATGMDMDDQAALVSQLDLVITVCQTCNHVAGGLGVPCWIMVPSRPSWREGVTGDMPWYNSVTLYRQSTDWASVIDKVANDLKELLDAHHRKLPRAKQAVA